MKKKQAVKKKWMPTDRARQSACNACPGSSNMIVDFNASDVKVYIQHCE
jgi:hypothetical protein